MNNDQLTVLKKHFHDYSKSFIEKADNPAPFILKKEHTMRVCKEILFLGKGLLLSENDLILAEAIALLHDIGRFVQLEKYGTFLDQVSENHAELGLAVIKEQGFLDFCRDDEAYIIKEAVGFHNAAEIPLDRDDRIVFFIRLIRDADKLDIWRVVTEHYARPDSDSEKIINLGLEDDGKISIEAIEAVCRRTFVKTFMIKNLNDLKLLQISWIFDLNFSLSVSRLKQKGYIDKIVATMPMSQDLEKALAHVREYMAGYDDFCTGL